MVIQVLSCSNGDEDSASVNKPQQDSLSIDKLKLGLLPTLTRAEILEGILSGEITGGTDTEPVEGPKFYKESSSEVTSVVVLGSFYAINQKSNIEHLENLGGAVQIKEGASITMTNKGKGLHIEGSGVTQPQSGFTNHTTLSLDIDDASLLESCKATITKIDLTTVSDVTMYGQSFTISSHLAASGIPMESDIVIYTYWKGGTITDYSYATDGATMSLYDDPSNFIEVWITFKSGSSVKARIGR